MADTAKKLPVSPENKPTPAMERWSPFDSLRSEIDRVFNEFTPGFSTAHSPACPPPSRAACRRSTSSSPTNPMSLRRSCRALKLRNWT